jgi:hypothetical protein
MKNFYGAVVLPSAAEDRTLRRVCLEQRPRITALERPVDRELVVSAVSIEYL